jgi:RecT family
MTNELTVTESKTSMLVPTNLTEAMKLAEMMANAKLVPAHLQGKPADCLLVIEQASRWNMSPFAVAQSTSVISGKLMYEGKLVSAVINASGALSGRLDFSYSGEGTERTIKVAGKFKGEDIAREVTVTLKEAKTTNGMWTKQPDQQLAYHGARVWARRHAPELMLGVYSPDEFDAVSSGSGPIIENEKPTVPELPYAKLHAEAREAAAQGSTAFNLFWRKSSKEDHANMVSIGAELRAAATAADEFSSKRAKENAEVEITEAMQ